MGQHVGDALTIRRARGGAVVNRFQGAANLNTAPVWESRSTFVFHAGYGCSGAPGEGYGCAYDTAVRCTVRGTCRQVAAPSDMKYFQERLLPPS